MKSPDGDRDPRLDETRLQPAGETATEKIERVEERLVANVDEAQVGSVRVHKRVVEEQEEIEVSLRHDELELERRKADRPLEANEKPIRTTGDTTVVLVIEERLETRRVPWVVEEIHLRRRIVTEQQTVADTVRKERFEISTEGDLDLDER
ncbi:MAG: YsnF/AvaK domain-containing protein [Actinomycetota bacterium]|nr:YsnF/AvaK domain-containing protein [Actinomycetota bacterium]